MYEYNKGTLPSAFSRFFLPLNNAQSVQYKTGKKEIVLFTKNKNQLR